MEKLRFKTNREFLEWNEEKGNFVTAVYDGGDYLCDVLQKDVLYLQNVGFLDEHACVIPALNIEQQEMFKESWGVEINILYDEICTLLTWYEHRDECPIDNDELFRRMYAVLVDVQNEMFNQ